MGRFFYNPFTKEMIKKKILFIHIPKAGGTSIATALYGKASGHPYLYQYYLANKHFTKTFYKFCVVRNPYDRLVSAFSHISNGNSNPELKLLFKELNIKSFDDLIFNLNDKIIYKKICKKTAHFRSQYEFIHHRNVCMDEIFKFEDFNSIEQSLNKQLNQKISIKKLNTSKRTHYRDYYNDFSIKVVKKIYKKDLEMFNYEF